MTYIIYMVPSSAGYPPRYGPMKPGHPRYVRYLVPSLGTCLPYLPLFLYLIEILANLANTTGFYTICINYDSINQHSHPSTTTPPTPTGGEAGNDDHPRQGWGGA